MLGAQTVECQVPSQSSELWHAFKRQLWSFYGGIFILMRNMKLTETQEQPFAMSNLNVPMQT